MNKQFQSWSVVSLALCLAACEQQTLPAEPVASAPASTAPTPAEAADTLNCKIEVLNAVKLGEGAQVPPLASPGKLELSGWVMLDHANRAPEAVSVEFVEAATPGVVAREYPAGERAERADVDKSFSAALGYKSGFVARMPAVDLPAGTYQVQVIGKDSGNRYACPHTAHLRVEAAAGR